MLAYFLKTIDNKGIHYIAGQLFYVDLDDLEQVLDMTRFETWEEANEFRTRRLPNQDLSIGEIIVKVQSNAH